MAVTKKRKAADDKRVAQSKWTEEEVFKLMVFLQGPRHTENVYLKQSH